MLGDKQVLLREAMLEIQRPWQELRVMINLSRWAGTRGNKVPRLYSFARNKSISVQAYAANPEAHSANIARTTTTHSHNAGSRHLWRTGHTCGDDPANTRQGSSTQFHSRPCSHQHFLGGYGNQNAATRSKNPPVDRVNTRNALVY
jgi:hypothetical protein